MDGHSPNALHLLAFLRTFEFLPDPKTGDSLKTKTNKL